MKKALLVLFLTAFCTLSFAGKPGGGPRQHGDKYSISTQMFMDERDGNLTFNRDRSHEKSWGPGPERGWKHEAPGRGHGRFIAKPDTIAGKAFISTFIRLDDNTDVAALEALGVEVECRFDGGLITARVPVDAMEQVAAQANVKRINVAHLMQKTTNNARKASNVDDALTNSADAIAAGLSSQYDGSGVVLGVIDTGIDFQHIAFKDKNGNYRIKRAYVYNGTSASEYSSFGSLTTDDSAEDHGTHTSSTAGGSSVIVSGSSVTVTDDHANATYGGMAPGSDLYLAGINGLTNTYLANAFQKIVNYADQQGKPVVVSNSWGSQYGPHDGTGDFADITAQYFGDNHPGHVCLFAASNDAGKGDGAGTGYHVQGTASSSKPLNTVLRSGTYSNTDDGYYYYGICLNAWSRSRLSSGNITCKLLVLDSSTGAVKTTITVNPTTSGATVSGLSNYYSGTLYAYKDYVDSNKSQLMLYSSGLTSKSYSKVGDTYVSKYTLAVQIYPTSGSCTVDAWGGTYGYFSNKPANSTYNWVAGSDDCCVSDEATDPNVIAIGAYVTKNNVTDYKGTKHDLSSTYTMGDIAYFSSYEEEGVGPTGALIPWITAPGATLASAVNHKHTSEGYLDDYYADYGMYRVNSNTTNPYGTMEGTSMATPAAAGIVALWMQAGLEANKSMTTSYVKEVMKNTAIKDAYTTTGANASHFGNGKIDALAGIQYILGSSAAPAVPTISVTPASLSFTGYASRTYTQKFTVTGKSLKGNITVAKSGSSVFSVSQSSVLQSNGKASAEITVTYAPTAAGTQTGTITLSSSEAESVTVALSGTATAATPTLSVSKSSLAFDGKVGQSSSATVTVTGMFTGTVNATVTGSNGVFSVSPATLTSAAVEAGANVTVTFTPSAEGTFTGTLTLTDGTAKATVALSGTAQDGGTASDPYLNIKNYASINQAGASVSGMTSIWKYAEDAANGYGWLTLSAYGAYMADANQNWITCSVNKTTKTTWTASSPFVGSSSYFSGSAYAIYYSTSLSSSNQTLTFYVTNASEVQARVKNSSKSYQSYIYVYKCTENSNGSLTASSSTTGSATSSSSTSVQTLKVSNLDASSIYKVVVQAKRSYIYEVAFKTPVQTVVPDPDPTLSVSPASLTFQSIVGSSAAQTFTVNGSDLKGDVSVAVSGTGFSTNVTSIKAADAQAGKAVTVTFAPTVAGTFNGTVTLSSTGAQSVSVALSGTAVAPTLSVSPASLSFSTAAGKSVSKSFTVNSANISGNVSLSLNDPSGVFTLSSTSVSSGSKTINVTFNTAKAGTYSGTVSVSAAGVATQTVTLSATATSNIRYKSSASSDWTYMVPTGNKYTITDGAYYAFEVTDNVDGADVDYVRTFATAGAWESWFMPFDVEVTESLLASFTFGGFQGITFASGADATEWQICVLELKAGDILYAGVPYAIKARTAGTKTISVSNVTLCATADVWEVALQSAANEFVFNGVYTQKTSTASDSWYSISGGTFTKVAGAGTAIKPFGVFLTVTDRTDNPYAGRSSLNGAVSFGIRAFGDATEIEQLSADEAVDNDVIYDLQGRRVTEPTSGIFIVGGKKVLMK